MSALKYSLWLSSAEGVSANAKAALLRHYGDAERAYFAPDGEYFHIKGISPREAELLEKRELGRVFAIEEACAEQNIAIISYDDPAYPSRLRNIFSPPPVIYVKGRIRNFDELPSVAVIGTRRASAYGLKMGREIASEICCCGGAVISLLGSGIDAEAARGALLAGGKCIGVLGTSHEEAEGSFCADVAASGALISEYPPGMKSRKNFFRERNRIASGISAGLVVVEAPERSGTRLFADEANEQGKEIFALPGNADAENCAGSNALIKEGAMLVTSGRDIMRELEPMFPGLINTELPAETKIQDKKAEKVTEEAEFQPETEKIIDKPKSGGYIDLREQLSGLSAEQLEIISAIDKNSIHIDDIIESTGLPPGKVLSQLTVLEIKGFVKREPGRRIRLNTAKK